MMTAGASSGLGWYAQRMGPTAGHTGGMGSGNIDLAPSFRKGKSEGGARKMLIGATTDESALRVNIGLGTWGGSRANPERTHIMERPVVPPLGFQIMSPRKLGPHSARLLIESLHSSREVGRSLLGSSQWEGRGGQTVRGTTHRTSMPWNTASHMSPHREGGSVMADRGDLEAGVSAGFASSQKSPKQQTGIQSEVSWGSHAGTGKRAVFKETSYSSQLSLSSTGAPYILSPPISLVGRPPRKVSGTSTLQTYFAS